MMNIQEDEYDEDCDDEDCDDEDDDDYEDDNYTCTVEEEDEEDEDDDYENCNGVDRKFHDDGCPDQIPSSNHTYCGTNDNETTFFGTEKNGQKGKNSRGNDVNYLNDDSIIITTTFGRSNKITNKILKEHGNSIINLINNTQLFANMNSGESQAIVIEPQQANLNEPIPMPMYSFSNVDFEKDNWDKDHKGSLKKDEHIQYDKPNGSNFKDSEGINFEVNLRLEKVNPEIFTNQQQQTTYNEVELPQSFNLIGNMCGDFPNQKSVNPDLAENLETSEGNCIYSGNFNQTEHQSTEPEQQQQDHNNPECNYEEFEYDNFYNNSCLDDEFIAGGEESIQLWREDDFMTPNYQEELLENDLEMDYGAIEVQREFYAQYCFSHNEHIEVQVGDCYYLFSRSKLDILLSKFRKLEKQYYFLRIHLPQKYRALFDKLICFKEFLRVETSVEHKFLSIQVNKSSTLVDKSLLKLIKLLLPLHLIASSLETILNEKPSQALLLTYVQNKFKEFLEFSNKILSVDLQILSKNN